MSRIDEFASLLRPPGLVRIPLGELCEFNRGRWIKADKLVPGLVPVVTSAQTVAEYHNESNRDGETVVVASSGAYAGFVSYWTQPIYLSNAFSVDPRNDDLLSRRYLFHFLKKHQPELHQMAQGAGVPNVYGTDVARLQFALPPLEVQREIVRILDHFTELEAELEAELKARRQQQAHFRIQLLSGAGSSSSETRSLGSIADFKYGYTAKGQDSGEFRFLRITDIDPWGKLLTGGAKYVDGGVELAEYVVAPGDLLMARTGATYGKTMLVSDGDPAVYASFLIRIRMDTNVVLPAYYWHFAQSELFWSQARSMVSTGGQPQFNANVLKLVELPVPPLEEQQRIVEALERFDALVNDLNIGLPAELAARRKQYEYYRNKLLTFEEAPA